MKTSQVHNALTMDLLRFVRDRRPTEAGLLEWLGQDQHGAYHVLRKAGLLALTDGVVRLSPTHYSAEQQSFRHEHYLYWLDRDQIQLLCSEPAPSHQVE